MACELCKAEFIEMLEKRMRAILAVAREENHEDMMVAHAECFHLIELQRKLQGLPTCGVYDEIPEPKPFELTP